MLLNTYGEQFVYVKIMNGDKMRKLIIVAMSLFSVMACTHTQAEITANNDLIIITDNFKVEDFKYSGSNLDSSSDQKEIIGSLGDKTVVAGEKAPDNLAYVKTPGDHNYIIKNTILVKCARSNADCIPSGLKAEKLSKTVYEITVNSYDEWKIVQEELRNTAGVMSVAPSYEQGIKPSFD